MKDLKGRTLRGGMARVCAQGANFALRLASLMVLARLLEPEDFGLVAMVTAVTGVLSLFRDCGLSSATVQRDTVTNEQISTLFWINILVGGALGLLTVAVAPVIVAFYHEPRLLEVTFVLAAGFVFNAAGVQHTAILQRQMRFTSLALIDTLSLFLSTAVGIGLAMWQWGYWALVAMTLTGTLVSTNCVWLWTQWVPGRPCKGAGVGSMMRFGGTVTLNGVVVYIAYNLEKVLLGRFWGPEVTGIYGRAYQLISIPTENLNSAIGGVAFSALSRVQDDAQRFKSYFLKGYSLVVALTLPITIACALLANDLILVVLGPKWEDAIVVFRLLAPTILILAMINPMSWLLFSLGMVGRSLKIALVLAPLVILGYVMGLSYGPTGVALGYSLVMVLWVVPHIAWCVHGTGVSLGDITGAVGRPLVSGIVAAGFAFGFQFFSAKLSPLSRLALEGTVLVGAYVVMLLFVMGQKTFYMDLFRGLKRPASVEEKVFVSA